MPEGILNNLRDLVCSGVGGVETILSVWRFLAGLKRRGHLDLGMCLVSEY